MGIDAGKVNVYITEHRTLGPLLNRIGAFSVYSSVWFSAIYLLLFISLVGCLVPRTFQQLRSLRDPLPRTPARPERLPVSAVVEVEQRAVPASLDVQAMEVAKVLRRRHYRVAVQEDGRAVSAERGRAARVRQPGLPPLPRRLVALGRGRPPVGLARRRDRARR